MAAANSSAKISAQTLEWATRAPRPPRRWLGRLLLHGTIIIFCMSVILPLLWVLLLSVKSIPDAYTGKLLPTQPLDFSHYGYVFKAIPTLIQNMGNSIVVTLSTVVLTSLCAVLAGY